MGHTSQAASAVLTPEMGQRSIRSGREFMAPTCPTSFKVLFDNIWTNAYPEKYNSLVLGKTEMKIRGEVRWHQ